MTAETQLTQPHNSILSSTRPFFFHGQGGTLFGIQIVNLFCSLITLGIYSFWGRVRVRKYLLSQTEFEGDRFAYHGTGRELLNGWSKAMLLFGLPLFCIGLIQAFVDPLSWLFDVLQILVYAIVAFFVPIAMVNTRRYRLSRLSWRAIRFSFRGHARDFIGIYVKGWLLTILTFGLYYPFWQNRRQTFMATQAYFGNQKFEFDGQGRDLFWSYLLHLLLTLPTLGLCWMWYWAKVQRYYASRTALRGARFYSTVTGGGLFGLWLVNAVLFIITIGLAWSWIAVRNARYFLGHLVLRGLLDVTTIMQEAQEASATGEALAGFLDLDFDLG